MNLRQPNANEATGTVNRSRDVAPCSGICTRCMDGCKGSCEIWLSSFRGREVLYPGPFGEITAGADKNYPIDYSHLNIQGYAVGAWGLPEGVEAGPDTAVFSTVDTETEYGWDKKVRMRLPIFTGALGSTEIARVNWEHFAIGAAISGITCVCGENVCGIDPGLKRDAKGKVIESPEMDRRINVYKKFYDGYGEMLVQMNVEDTGLGPRNMSQANTTWIQSNSNGARVPSALVARSRSSHLSGQSSSRSGAISSCPIRQSRKTRWLSKQGRSRNLNATPGSALSPKRDS